MAKRSFSKSSRETRTSFQVPATLIWVARVAQLLALVAVGGQPLAPMLTEETAAAVAQLVSAHFDWAELERLGVDHFQGIVGQGGLGSQLLGQRGASGEDTVINLISKDGTVMKTLRASGGLRGRSGTAYLPDGVAELSAEDISDGFRITTLMPANAAEFRDGLLFVLGGGWKWIRVAHIPIEYVWCVICTATWRTFKQPKPRGVFLSLNGPSGDEASCQTLTIPGEAMEDGCRHWINTIGVMLDNEGTWTLRVHSGGCTLAEVDVRVLAEPESKNP
jgi:hypothetical protein